MVVRVAVGRTQGLGQGRHGEVRLARASLETVGGAGGKSDDSPLAEQLSKLWPLAPLGEGGRWWQKTVKDQWHIVLP
jgi:hypothetical protein